jgi:hypothetical protein
MNSKLDSNSEDIISYLVDETMSLAHYHAQKIPQTDFEIERNLRKLPVELFRLCQKSPEVLSFVHQKVEYDFFPELWLKRQEGPFIVINQKGIDTLNMITKNPLEGGVIALKESILWLILWDAHQHEDTIIQECLKLIDVQPTIQGNTTSDFLKKTA